MRRHRGRVGFPPSRIENTGIQGVSSSLRRTGCVSRWTDALDRGRGPGLGMPQQRRSRAGLRRRPKESWRRHLGSEHQAWQKPSSWNVGGSRWGTVVCRIPRQQRRGTRRNVAKSLRKQERVSYKNSINIVINKLKKLATQSSLNLGPTAVAGCNGGHLGD